MEFGLVKNAGGLRIFGNGILSCFSETQHSRTEEVLRKRFDADVVAATPYDIWHFQDLLFVIESFDQLGDAFEAWVRRNISAVSSRAA